jgi:periplasmic protein CpxP/Spy
MLKKSLLVLAVFIAGAYLYAQSPPDNPPGDPHMGNPRGFGGESGAFHWLLPGKWWKHPQAAEELKLSPDQINKLDDIFLKYKTSMIDIRATIEKKELELDTLLDKNVVDDATILKKADDLIATKGELQKTYLRMLLEMKKILTPDQVKKIKEFRDKLPMRQFEEHRFMRGQEPHERGSRPPQPPSVSQPEQPPQPPQAQ